MIPTPIRQALSTIRSNGVRALLMGGQACVFYGAAQVSRDVDLLLLAEQGNLTRLGIALEQLKASRIAVPPMDAGILARGHAVHFRCQAPGVEGLRIDVMTRLRGCGDFDELWERRTVLGDDSGMQFELLSVPDLVKAKKTQRSKDWPMIDALVVVHYRENQSAPTPVWIAFWMMEARSPELLVDLAARFPVEARELRSVRRLLDHAIAGDLRGLREALDAEVRAEQEIDRAYWEPLKKELEGFRKAQRECG